MLVFNLNIKKKMTKRRDGWMDGWKESETYRGVGFVVFGRFVLLSSSSSLRDVGSVMLSMLCFLVLKGDMVPMVVKQSECERSLGQDLHKSVMHIT